MIRQLALYGLLIGILSIVSAARGQEAAPAPVFKEGDTWQFSFNTKGRMISSTALLTNGIYELTFVQGKIKLYSVEEKQKTEMEIKPEGSTQNLLKLIGKSEQQPLLRFPLSVGQKYSYEYKTRLPNTRRDITIRVDVQVLGMEEVNTPAGSFKSYKLEETENFPAGSTRTSTLFFSPETKRVIKRSAYNPNTGANTVTELIKFTPGS